MARAIYKAGSQSRGIRYLDIKMDNSDKSSLISIVLVALRWSLSIGGKFFRVVPKETVSVVFSTLVSQITLLLAFLLPLKILMLLGSAGIPRYFPAAFDNVDRNVLVVLLSLSAIGFYIIHHVAERFIVFSADRGSRLLLERNQKIALFDNQEEVASRGYQRYSRSLAGSIFLLLVSSVLAWLYPELLAVLMGFSVAAFSLFVVLYAKGGKIKEGLDEAPGRIVNTATSVGFLVAFGFMVSHFLFGTPPGLLVAIVSLILMRQGFSRLTALINDLKGLYTQRFKLNALFFHGHVLIKEAKKHETNFWSLLDSSLREQWVLDILQDVVPRPVANVKIRWWQLGGQDIAYFQVSSFDCENSKIADHLIKLFNTNRRSLAKHEATLLSGDTVLPALSLVCVDEVSGLHCHVFKWAPIRKISKEQLSTAKQKVVEKLLSVEPEQALASQFKRSRPPIWQRVDSRVIERLHTVAEMLGSHRVDQVQRFGEQLATIMSRLRELPLAIVNPELGPDVILENEKDGELLLAHWGRWSLEPVGANWPVEASQLEYLGDALERAKDTRVALRDVCKEDVCLAALVFSLEKFYARQAYVSALNLIPRILSCLETAPAETKATV